MAELPATHREAAEKVGHRLDLEYVDPPSLSTLAMGVGLSPFQLSRIFGTHHGMSIPRYIRRLRLARAAELLATTDRMVGEVMAEVGYSSASAFVRAFTEETGRTPSEHRAVVREAARPFAESKRTASGRLIMPTSDDAESSLRA